MDLTAALALVLAAIVVGALIGSIGIGGVLLVPALVYVGRYPVHLAISTSMFSFFFAGAVGLFAGARYAGRQLRGSWGIFLAAIPGAILGSTILVFASEWILRLVTAAIMLLAGFTALRRSSDVGTRERPISLPQQAGIGSFTGILSALSGTSGPVVLVPIMLMLEAPLLTAVYISQVVQLPIAGISTVVNMINGTVDFSRSWLIAVFVCLGCMVGLIVARRVPAKLLSKVAGYVFVCLGFLIALHTILLM